MRYTQKYRFKNITNKKTKKRLELFHQKSHEIPSLRKKILFAISTYYRADIFDIKTGKSKRGEYIQDKIIKILEKLKLDIVRMDLDYSFRGQFDIFKERIDDSMSWFPIEAVMENKTLPLEYEHLVNNYIKIINDKKFQSLFSFNGINFWELVKDDFIKLTYAPHLPTYVNLIFSLDRFFSKNSPLAIFLPYETGPLALCIILASKIHNIKTIGIQHGIIYPNCSDYSHTEFRDMENPYGFPLPDHMLLFGNYAKKILSELNYPAKKLNVFGNIEFTDFNAVKKLLNLENLRKKNNIPLDKKVIIFASSRIQSYYEGVGGNHDELVLKKLLETFANNPKYFVILKPHPGEYIGTYKKLIEDSNCKNFKILQGNLFEILFMSDIVVSIFSTILLDSIALEKTTLRVIFEGSSPLIPYEKYSVLQECDLNSLKKNIEELLSDETKQQKLIDNRSDFILDQYNIPNNNMERLLKKIFDL